MDWWVRARPQEWPRAYPGDLEVEVSRSRTFRVARGWTYSGEDWGDRGLSSVPGKIGTTEGGAGGAGGRYERQRKRREELLAATSRRDRPGRRSTLKVCSGKRGNPIQASTQYSVSFSVA